MIASTRNTTKYRYVLFGAVVVCCTFIVTKSILRDDNVSGPNTVINVDQLIRRDSSQMTSLDTSMLKASNGTVDKYDFLMDRYGPVKFSGVRNVNTTLTPEEKKRYGICVQYAKRDRAMNGSRFWGKEEHIRRTHHTYLRRNDAILIEVGGKLMST